MTMTDPYGGFSAGDARFAPPAGAPPLSVPGKADGQELPADSYVPHGAPVKENGTQEIYHYCLVRFSGSESTLSYRTEDRTLQPGDRVRAPYGRDNAPRTGKVAAVGDYTAADAPYPPEKTKLLFGRASAQEADPELSADLRAHAGRNDVGLVLARLQGRVEGWKAALGALLLFVLFSVVR